MGGHGPVIGSGSLAKYMTLGAPDVDDDAPAGTSNPLHFGCGDPFRPIVSVCRGLAAMRTFLSTVRDCASAGLPTALADADVAHEVP